MTFMEYFQANWDMGRRTHSWYSRLSANSTFIVMVAFAFWLSSKTISMPPAQMLTHEEHHREHLVNEMIQN